MNIPLVADMTKRKSIRCTTVLIKCTTVWLIISEISRDYGVLLEDAGHTLRGLFIIDPKGIIRQITINDLPVGRYVFNTFTSLK